VGSPASGLPRSTAADIPLQCRVGSLTQRGGLEHAIPSNSNSARRLILAVHGVISVAGLFALPAAAQDEEGPPSGTPANGTNPDSPSSPPDLVTIAAEGCRVSEGASVTLEDGDGTQARFVDGERGIEITSTSDQIRIEGPDDDFIGDHAVSQSDPGFDTDGDYAVVSTTGIACEDLGPSPSETGDDEDPGAASAQYGQDRDTTVPEKSPPEVVVKKEVITKTIPEKSLPVTGGLSRWALTVFSLALVGAGVSLRIFRGR
jgi:hypothetical protein